MLTKEKFLNFYKDNSITYQNALRCWESVEKEMQILQAGICPTCQQPIPTTAPVSPLIMAGLMATARVEGSQKRVEFFLPIEEYASGVAYEGRIDLGNVQKGDGMRFKGRGLIQLTGRKNYALYGHLLGIDLENHPELALDPVNSAKILALYFKLNNVTNACLRSDWLTVRKLVNGVNKATGMPNGWPEFNKIINQYI